jgi:hypothetical protein
LHRNVLQQLPKTFRVFAAAIRKYLLVSAEKVFVFSLTAPFKTLHRNVSTAKQINYMNIAGSELTFSFTSKTLPGKTHLS